MKVRISEVLELWVREVEEVEDSYLTALAAEAGGYSLCHAEGYPTLVVVGTPAVTNAAKPAILAGFTRGGGWLPSGVVAPGRPGAVQVHGGWIDPSGDLVTDVSGLAIAHPGYSSELISELISEGEQVVAEIDSVSGYMLLWERE